LDIAARTSLHRWHRAVDLLWREAVGLRRAHLQARERARAERRRRSLQRIVRRALSEYHRIQMARLAEERGRRPPKG
jgi:hypothetical protein